MTQANVFIYSRAADGHRFLINVYATDEEPWMWLCTVVKPWNLDRDDPR